MSAVCALFNLSKDGFCTLDTPHSFGQNADGFKCVERELALYFLFHISHLGCYLYCEKGFDLSLISIYTAFMLALAFKVFFLLQGVYNKV